MMLGIPSAISAIGALCYEGWGKEKTKKHLTMREARQMLFN